MSTTVNAPRRTDDGPGGTPVLRRVGDLVPTIADRAADIERARRLPPDLLAALRDTGCFGLLLPSSHGGTQAPFPSAIDMFETIGRADASAAWAVAIAASVWLDLVGLPRTTFDMVYDRPDRIVAGVFGPSGTATMTRRGCRVGGRWAFASGCVYADWIYLNAMETVDGAPSMRTVVLRPDEVEIEDTWHALGLRGSASHHVRVDDVTIPAERTFATFDGAHCVDTPMTRTPVPSAIGVSIAAIALGAARGALDDVVALAAEKTPLLADAPLGTNPRFQHDLARADVQLRAASSLLRDAAEALWAGATAGVEPAPTDIAGFRAAAAWSVTVAQRTATMAFGAAGGTAVYDASPLQRRLRDLCVIGQHFLVKPDTLTTAGAVLAGRPIDVPVF